MPPQDINFSFNILYIKRNWRELESTILLPIYNIIYTQKSKVANNINIKT